ncbi:MAG: BON domain-containing protein [Aquisalimonadaceae bacterium]
MSRFSRLLSIFLLAFTVFGLVGCAATETRQAPGEYIDDSVITTKVKTAIFNEPDLKVLEINVETFRGEVQLSGFVSSQAAANRAVTVARGVGGVTSVKNGMQIK